MKLSEVIEKTVEWWTKDKYCIEEYSVDDNKDFVLLTSRRATNFCVLGALAKTCYDEGMARGIPLDEFDEDFALQLLDYYRYFHQLVPIVRVYFELNGYEIDPYLNSVSPTMLIARINDEYGYDEVMEFLLFAYNQARIRGH